MYAYSIHMYKHDDKKYHSVDNKQENVQKHMNADYLGIIVCTHIIVSRHCYHYQFITILRN